MGGKAAVAEIVVVVGRAAVPAVALVEAAGLAAAVVEAGAEVDLKGSLNVSV